MTLLPTLEFFVDEVKSREGSNGTVSVPMYVYGHSMGGLVTINYLQDEEGQKQFKAAILSAPPVAVPEQVTNALLMTAKALSAVVPQAGVEKLNIDTLVKDKEEAQRYMTDPLVYHDSIKARTGLELVLASQMAKDNWANKISLPVLYIQGMKDKVVPSQAAEPFFKAMSSKDKTLYKFLEGYHETHNDYTKQKSYSILTKWLGERLTNSDMEANDIIEVKENFEEEKQAKTKDDSE